MTFCLCKAQTNSVQSGRPSAPHGNTGIIVIDYFIIFS